jgi:curved DNA-binding protein CbpA
MSEKSDLYLVLGVAPTAESVVVRAAFKALILKYHPDTNRSVEANQRTMEINAAFTVLGNPIKRRRYDALRRAYAERDELEKQTNGKAHRVATFVNAVGIQRLFPNLALNAHAWLSSEDENNKRQRRRAGGWAAALVGLAVIKLLVTAVLQPSAASPIKYVGHATAAQSDKPHISSDIASALANEATAAPLFGTAAMVDAPPPTLTYDDIESAAQNFERIFRKDGMAGARAFSESCHKAVISVPSWSAADRCAAFDYSASFIDQGATRESGADPNGYFAFQKDNQANNYRSVGGASYLGPRLAEIEKTASAAVSEAHSVGIEETEAASNVGETVPANKAPLQDMNANSM